MNRCLELGRIEQDEEKVLARIRLEYGVLPKNPYVAAGFLGEFYTRMKAEELAQSHQDVSIFWMARPVITNHYVFLGRRERPNIRVQRRLDARRIGEIDLVIIVEDEIKGTQTPIIIETHLARYKGYHTSVRNMLQPARIERKRELIGLLFNNLNGEKYQRPVVVYVVPKEQLKKLTVRESNMYRFVENGDLVVPFHTTKRNWIGEVERIIAACNGEKTDMPENGHKRPLAV